MKLRQSEKTLATAASKAGMDERTARKYLQSGILPSQGRSVRTWRTRPDIFQAVWPEVEAMLERESTLEAITIFDYLCRKYEGQFKEGHLRTLQRRIKVWRARAGPPKEVMFPQQHRPGEQGQSDFTHMGELGITIQGQPFDHLIYHFTLPYSNWEAGTVCFSESFESLSQGLQNALWELGAVPQEHRTDSLSAAINNLSSTEEWTDRYKGLLSHYGLRASHNHPGRAHENGDVEQSHYRVKQAVEQELLLCGGRDFSDRAAYERFLHRLLHRRNGLRQDKLREELAVMRRLPERRLEDYTREIVKVSRNSTILVRRNLYSVNSQLIGERVEVRVYAEHLEVWYGQAGVQQMPRRRGSGQHAIDYRHIIHSLVRKPGALAHYRYQSSLFPRLLFRVAYDDLQAHYPATADRQYVKILELAAGEGEDRVEQVLRGLLERGEAITEAGVREGMQTPALLPLWEVPVPAVSLSAYDALLSAPEVTV